jgi:triacylglycerol lipase
MATRAVVCTGGYWEMRKRLIRSIAVAALVVAPIATHAAFAPDAEAVVPQNPILFVHGFNSSASTWNTAIGYFQSQGYSSAQLRAFSYNTSQSNATTANTIASQVNTLLANNPGATKVDIVAHSMGALSSRYYVKNLGGTAKVDELVTLAGANQGTTWAYGCFFLTSCQQMFPGSSFVNQLNAAPSTPGPTRHGAWWSACDGVILPNSNATIPGGINTQTACLGHSAVKDNSTVLGQVLTFVNS